MNMKDPISSEFLESARVTRLAADALSGAIAEAGHTIASAFKRGGKLLIVGNGGSAAEAQHLAAELVGHFKRKRKALPAIALTTDTSVLSAIGNDDGFEFVFSRQVEALANHPADVLLAISTSGNSPNVIRAVECAKRKKLQTIGLTGERGKLKDMVTVAIAVPSKDTQRIQEAHGVIVHILCDLIERELFA